MGFLHSKDRFAPRVRVISPAGDHIYTVHAEEAARMVRSGQAEKRGGARRVAQIALVCSLMGERRGPCSPASVRQYTGQKYTYRQAITREGAVVAYVTAFKHISKRDRPLFLLRVTDCLSERVAA